MENKPELQEHTLLMEQINRQKQQTLERYRRLNQFVIPGQILFVGSSLTEQFPINELLMDLDHPFTVYNRGVSGFTTTELEEVLDVCVYDLKPKHIFINIGTNDLNDANYTVSDLIGRYKRILCCIQSHLPDSKLYLLAYYPVNEIILRQDPFAKELFKNRANQQIYNANEAIRNLADEMGAAYLDLNEALVDANGNMKADYTVEGIHIHPNGYMAVLKHLLPVLQAICH
ncbi:MAG: GDSL-type esterase/lipase family protein [Oscillospiraceae bacterium]